MTRSATVTAFLGLLALNGVAWGQQQTGSIKGKVADPSGAGVPDAAVEVTGVQQKSASSGARGDYSVPKLAAGTYTVAVRKRGFAPFTKAEVEVQPGRATELDVALALAAVEERVEVRETQTALSLSEASGAGAIVIKGADLDALPDDPDELAEALQALAGPAAGPTGGQIDVDGFSGARIPPKSAIREIRVNASPFSAEYDRPGHGHIEILTKPGSEEFQAQGAFNFNNQALNARDPYAANEPDYQRTMFGASLSGPLPGRTAAYELEVERRAIDDTAVVSGTRLGADLQPTSFQQAVVAPQVRTQIEPRLDFQIGRLHTLTVRYEYESVERDQGGVGGFALASRAYDTKEREHELRLGGTSVFGRTVNELRFRWSHETQDTTPLGTKPSLSVLDAFGSGGAGVGLSSERLDRLELQELVSRAGQRHSLRAGLRFRNVSRDETSRRDFNGAVTFAGGLGPQLDAASRPLLGPDGQPVMQELSSLERYRRTLLFRGLGLSAAEARALGGGASQLQIAGGDPLASVSQWDLGVFVQDDWKLRPDLMLGVGLRYEVQDNIESGLDLSPRLTLAWSPGGKQKAGSPKTVLRAGFGVFYDRIGDNLTLDARRYDGLHQHSYLVTDPLLLDRLSFSGEEVSGIPTPDELLAYAVPQTVRVVDQKIRTPRNTQWSLSAERALPGNLSLVVNYVGTRIDRALRSRVLETGLAEAGPRVHQYESTGRFRQDQLAVGLNSRLSAKLGLSLRYTLGWARSDTDGATSFPSDQGNPGADWGRAGMDERHRLMLMGRLETVWGFRLSPFVIVSSGRPFDITTGRDDNGDGIFNDRPAYATDPRSPDAVRTRWGVFDAQPAPGQARIPRNLGQGPAFVVVNLRLSRTFSLRRATADAPAEDPGRGPGIADAGPGHGPGHGPGGHGPGHGAGHGVGEGSGGPGLTLSLSVQNLLNRTNPSTPVGNLSSPRFGESLSTAGGFGRGGGGSAGSRRIDLQLRLSF